MRCSYKCAEKKKHKVQYISEGKRMVFLEEYGGCSFVFPEGTPKSKGDPRYPVMTESGCLDCSLTKAAYNRMSQQLGKPQPAMHRKKLLSRRKDLVRLALARSEPGDERNACNWSIAAGKRLKIKS